MNSLDVTLRISKLSAFEEVDYFCDSLEKYVKSGFFIDDAKCVRVKEVYKPNTKRSCWILRKNGDGKSYDVWECEKCGRRIRIYPDDNISNYPECVCGAKMVKNALKIKLKLLCSRRSAVGDYPANGTQEFIEKKQELSRLDSLIVDTVMEMYNKQQNKNERK